MTLEPEGRPGGKIDAADKIDATQRRYAKSPKGKKARKKWNESEAAKAVGSRYLGSEKGKLAHKRYRKSKKGKAAIKKAEKRNKELLAKMRLVAEREKQGLCALCGSREHRTKSHPNV